MGERLEFGTVKVRGWVGGGRVVVGSSSSSSGTSSMAGEGMGPETAPLKVKAEVVVVVLLLLGAAAGALVEKVNMLEDDEGGGKAKGLEGWDGWLPKAWEGGRGGVGVEGAPKETGAGPPPKLIEGRDEPEVVKAGLPVPKREDPLALASGAWGVVSAAAGDPKGEDEEGGAPKPKPKVGLAPDGGPPKREEEPPALGLLSAQAGSLPSAFLALGLPSRPVSQAGQVCWSSRLREKHPSHLHPLS